MVGDPGGRRELTPRAGLLLRSGLLVGPLLGFLGLRLGPGLLGLGLLLGDLTLGGGLVLLGLALALEVLVAGDRADGLLGLALHVLDDALDAGLGAAVLVCHIDLLGCVRVPYPGRDPIVGRPRGWSA